MIKKALILPYFGTFPNYFIFFLESVKANHEFDFILFTDQTVGFSAQNLQIVQMTWSEMQKRIRTKLGEDVCIEKPYKLCDYRPAYGHIFSDYLSEYDYWGHCDCDLIFGDLSLLRKYFTDDYERIGECGHLIFYKNTNEVNSYFRTLRSSCAPSWDTVSHTPKSCSYDEYGGMNQLCEENRILYTHPRLFDDIIFYRKNFYSRRDMGGRGNASNPRTPIFFEYENGHLFRHYFLSKKWHKDESLYVHFQKRSMLIETNNIHHFLMIPNKFISPSISRDSILKECSPPLIDFKYAHIMFKYHVRNFLKFLTK